MTKFTTFNFKKVNFLKNNSSECGALNEILRINKDNKNVIHMHNKKHGRAWGLCSEDKILKLVAKNSGIYEVITKYPFKIYFDIDKQGKQDSSYLTEIKAIILKYFKDANLSISGSITDKKTSYHITLNNYLITNEEEKNSLKYLVKYFNTIEDGFDWKIYTKNRNMKAINQSKIGRETQDIIEDTEIKNHLITFFLPTEYNKIKYEETNEIQEVKLMDTQNYLDLSTLPELPSMELSEDIDIENPEHILKLCPIGKGFSHQYTHKIARFCYYNSISFETFYKWYSAKNDDNIKKWRYHWDNLHKFNKVVDSDILFMLNKYYPTILNSQHLNKFTNLFKLPEDKILEIESINQTLFNGSHKCTVFNVGMGGGKTTQTLDYLKSSKKNFIWITPNISLAENTSFRMKEKKIKHTLYNDKADKKKTNIKTADNLIICLNSLIHTAKKYKILVIDEVETLLNKWFNNETLKPEQLNICWMKFIEIFREAEKIILLDAFTSKITINFLESLEISNYIIFKRKNETNPRKALRVHSYNNLISDAIRKIKAGKKVLIFYPFKSRNKKYDSMEDIRDNLEKETGKKGQYYCADSSDSVKKELRDVNKNWSEYDFIISNNVITVGINYDKNYFDQVYLVMANFSNPRDIIQFSYRTRTLKDNTIKYCFLDKKKFKQDYIKNEVATSNTIYQKLFNDILKERHSPLIDTFLYFLYLAKYDISNKKIFEYEINKEFIEFESTGNYYDYNNIEDINYEDKEHLQRKLYSKNLDAKQKVQLRKYFFNNQFNKTISKEELAEIWNSKKVDFAYKLKEILTDKEHVLNKLKNNYKWSLHFTEELNGFKFTKDDLKLVFDSIKFKDLTTKSKHNLILKNFINTVFNQNIYISKKDKSNNYKTIINDKIKHIYLVITNHLKIIPDAEFI